MPWSVLEKKIDFFFLFIKIRLEILVCWTKEHEETFGVDAYDHCLDWGDGFTVSYICQKVANGMF